MRSASDVQTPLFDRLDPSVQRIYRYLIPLLPSRILFRSTALQPALYIPCCISVDSEPSLLASCFSSSIYWHIGPLSSLCQLLLYNTTLAACISFYTKITVRFKLNLKTDGLAYRMIFKLGSTSRSFIVPVSRADVYTTAASASNVFVYTKTLFALQNACWKIPNPCTAPFRSRQCDCITS